MNRYKGKLKTRRAARTSGDSYAIERLGTGGWIGVILVTFLCGALCGVLRAKFGG